MLFFLYLGPGLGGGLIALVVGFVISFFTLLIAVLWYPFKKFIAFLKRIFKK
jgi:hypothetical protein